MTGNVHNLLLYWISERGKLATQTVRDACTNWHDQLVEQKQIDKLDKPFYVWMDALRRSGHVEFDRRECFSVSSVFIVISEDDTLFKGFFCGRRDKFLWNRLQETFGSAVSQTPQTQAADRWSYQGPRQDLEVFLSERKILCQMSPTDLLLKKLPDLNQALKGFCQQGQASLEGLKSIYRDNKWEPIDKAQVSGLFKDDYDQYCFRRAKGEGTYYLKIGEPLQLARWWTNVVEGHVKLSWNRENKTLAIRPIALQLPMLLDRLLRLAHGAAPKRTHDGSWCYQGISQDTASEVSRIMMIKLEEE